MSNNVTTQSATLATVPASTTIATDDVSGVHFQLVKIVDATEDGTNRSAINSSGQLASDPHPSSDSLAVTSAGLTTSSTTYAAGDQVGTIFDFSPVPRAAAGHVVLTNVDIIDKARVLGDVELWLFNTNPTLASDNSAFAISDTDMTAGKWLTTISFSTTTDRFDYSNGYAFSKEVTRVIETASASQHVYGALKTLSANTVFSTTTDVVVNLSFLQD